MNFKATALLSLLMPVIFLMNNLFKSPALPMIMVAVLFLIQAILFTVKAEYFEKFVSFTNPGLYSAFNEKGKDFINKRRRNHIFVCYFGALSTGFSVYMLIMAAKMWDIKPVFSLKDILSYTLVMWVFVFSANYLHIHFTRKSKTSKEYWKWNIIIGIGLAVIMMVFLGMDFSRLIP